MRKPIDWGLEYGFIRWNQNGWEDMCWYAELGYKDLPHFLATLIKWMFKKDVYFKINLNNKWIYVWRRIDYEQ